MLMSVDGASALKALIKQARMVLFDALVATGMSEMEAIRTINRALMVKQEGHPAHPADRDAIVRLAPHQLSALEKALGPGQHSSTLQTNGSKTVHTEGMKNDVP
jgi:hypothetical protein